MNLSHSVYARENISLSSFQSELIVEHMCYHHPAREEKINEPIFRDNDMCVFM